MRNKKRIAASVACAAALLACQSGYLPTEKPTANAASAVLAFPGAVGGGSYATGGRGGEVVHVTNLNDSGAGSFRDAVGTSNRIVVFDVSGTIELKSNILVASNVTIAGQTAPGGSGITLKNYKLGMSGDNIICRYISSRPGPYASTSSGNDAWGGAQGSHSIIDHCSMGWTTDEQWGLYSKNEYYTVQYSVIGPADSWGGHSKGIHGFGLMMGKGFSTFDHNLIVHNVSRNFRGKVVGTSTADFTNNVIYNWAYQTAYGTIGHLNYVNNTLKMGNGTVSGKHYVSVDSSTSPENFSIYLGGNRMLNKDDTIYDTVTSDNWNGISVKDGLGITKDSVKSNTAFETIVNGVNVSTALTCESAEDSYNNVLNFAGNGIAPTLRTAIDQQSAYEALTGTGNLSGTATYEEATDDEKSKLDGYKIQCGVTYTYPSAVLEKTITDSDNDGMPDEWELLRGLNPNDAADTNGDYCGMGYTNIEYYINDLTIDSFPAGVVTLSPEIASLEPISAFEQIEAENYATQSGVQTEDCPEGGQNVGYIENGDYIMFRNVDFEDGGKSFFARVSANTAGAAIEICLDSLNNTPVGICKITEANGFGNYFDVSCNTATITDRHTVYLKFTGGESYLLNINYFVFGRETIPLNGTLITNLLINDTENGSDWSISADPLAEGALLYGDREVIYGTLPEALTGAEYIKTACDSKNYTDTLASFTAGADLTAYVAMDTRVTTIPEWLTTWEITDLSFTASNDVTFAVYQKPYKAGDVITLGTNGQSAGCVGYLVMTKAAPAEGEEEEETNPVLYGDTNCDTTINIADLVLLARYVSQDADLQTDAITEQGIINANVNIDDAITADDITGLSLYLAGTATLPII
ncbi:MAG: carbohydrate-binding protein [Ruminococcus sp.]|nr:carbohydrate-binding protein [Ruminococcus sp.]